MKKEKEKRRKSETPKSYTEFSKWLLIQESGLIWVITIVLLVLAFFCVFRGYFGELPWITAMVGLPWTAYGVSQAFYYRKAQAENTKDGIKFEAEMAKLENAIENQDCEENAIDLFQDLNPRG